MLPFSGTNRIEAYFDELNRALDWNSDNHLYKSYSINRSTVVFFSVANANALSNSDFFGLLYHSIPYRQISYNDSKKADIRKALDEISKAANNIFL